MDVRKASKKLFGLLDKKKKKGKKMIEEHILYYILAL